MEEKNNKTEPQEVVLQYVAPSREVVSCYVAPGRTPQLPQSAELPPKRGKGRRRFLIALTILAVLALAAAGFNLLGSVSIGFGTGDGYYYFGSDPQDFFEDEAPGEPAMPRFTDYDDSVRLLITEQRGEALPVQEIYERVNPSTVTVVAEIEGNRAGIGTGIIMTADGYILTNAHVIADALDCFIVLDTGEQYDVSLVGYDMEQDIAVLKAEAEGLPAAQFGDSDALRVGDPVYAIGNPLGIELRGTLTDGIVSAINRDVELDGVRMTLIQTNAALNSGNSGGPLINACGQVVGINLMKMDRSGRPIASVEGLGFAIPIVSVAYMVDDIIACGEVRG
ncbi:MAG: trypsin-like peptidase domain-containing protein, partial [Oscillospiraceae bacterium]|nr:trypsin-like peptidase domain-containing protein [Oscillospiraceae bacterium]